jgi:type I restriction enzyme S subunit
VSPPRYPLYKSASAEWMGRIPAHWKDAALRRVTRSMCDGPFGSDLKSSHYSETGVRVIRLQNIGSAEFRADDAAFIDVQYFNSLGGHDARPGDLLIAALGDENHPVGRACVLPDNVDLAMVKADCFRFRLDTSRLRAKFGAYFLSSTIARAGFALLTRGATRERVNLSSVAAISIPLPSPHEQDAIIGFLDRETTKIDALIAKQTEFLTLLDEHRRASVTETVTKGLDPSVPVRDSGIEWLGSIPTHWNTYPLGRVLKFISYGFTNPMPTSDDGPFMLTANDVGDGRILYETARRTTPQAFKTLLTSKSRPEKDDILLTKDGTLGRVARFTGAEACINQSVAILRTDSKIVCPRFLEFVLRSSLYNQKMVFDAGGTTIKHIGLNRFAVVL